MMDFMDALIDRHMNATPHIVPRLPSIYESEISHGGWDVAAPNNASEMEETVFAGPIMPMKETERTRVEPTDFQPSTLPTTPVVSPSTVEPVQENAGQGLVALAAEGKPSVKVGLHEPESSFSLKAKAFDAGLPKSSADIRIAPVIGEVGHKRKAECKEQVSPHREATPEDRPFVNKARAANDRDSGKADLRETVISRSQTEKRVSAGPTETSAADLIAPLTIKVRHVHRDERVEQGAPHPEVKADDRPFLKKDPGEPVLTPSRQERVEMRELNSARERRIPTFSEGDQGLLKPSAALITPVPPSVGGPERSTSQTAPVINVTIGRVEVRASVPPQKQAPRPANRPPVMGLDEYLRRRSGGHDR
jgi:hypothetical protein